MALMLIVDAYPEHAGKYSCRAANSAGEAACAATLTVTAKGKAPLAPRTLICCLPFTATNARPCCLFYRILPSVHSLLTN